uniref:Angel homolog 2 (Drosophila) n=1 Tax=Labrus bergylta TaxID=56723 RepID=A0A3Q3EVN5_9LABR
DNYGVPKSKQQPYNLSFFFPSSSHHMFLRQLSSSFLPHSRPALCRAGFSGASYLPHFLPAPHPWWSAQRFPPRPPGLPPSHPAAHQVYSGRTFHTLSIYSSDFGGSRRSFHASAGLMMERHDRDRGPPQKRRKSVEEKRTDFYFNLKFLWVISLSLSLSLSSALERRWEPSPSACTSYPLPPGCSTAFDFSVMSYNILSQELLQDNAYLYRHCHPGVLPWKHRLPNLLAEIQQYDADILCLQEVQEDHYENQIKPALQALGYQCEYKKRTGSKPDGCAVIFKSSRLSLLSSNPVEYLRPGDALLDRDNVGLVLLLRPNDATAAQPDPSAFICVANTHLLYNPRRGDIKLAQLAILLAEIRRLSSRSDGSTSPVVLCGDFNSTPWSPLYSFLTTGCLDYRGMQIGMVSGQESNPRGQRLLPSPIWSNCLGIDHQCQYNKPSWSRQKTERMDFSHHWGVSRIEHGLKLQSSYQHRLMPDGRPEITTCHSRTAMTVDYILFTPEFVTPPSLPGGWGLQLLGRLSLVGQSELEEVDGLPNRHHSSDHLPLLTRFRLRR